jgi:hypothetical protein
MFVHNLRLGRDFLQTRILARQKDPIGNSLYPSAVPQAANDCQVTASNANVFESSTGRVPLGVIARKPCLYDPGLTADDGPR